MARAGALGYGGAIYNLGALALTNCTFTGNTACAAAAAAAAAPTAPGRLPETLAAAAPAPAVPARPFTADKVSPP